VGPAHFAANFWWLLFPLSGTVFGAVRTVAAANERRANRRLERYRIKQQAKIAIAEASGRGRADDDGRRREIVKLLAAHDRIDARWLDYEVDIARLLDFPLMTDLRNPLTVAFHKARQRADLLRPERPDDLLGDRDAQLEYREAVHEYVSAFEIAETEAVRRRRSDFSENEQERLARAQHLLRLAADDAASPQERQSAYAKAGRELEGLIALPAAARAGIERRIAAQIEA
jgi:hypothetical protein